MKKIALALVVAVLPTWVAAQQSSQPPTQQKNRIDRFGSIIILVRSMVSLSLRLLDRIRALRSAEALASKLVVAHGANASSGAGDGRCEMAPVFLFPLNPPHGRSIYHSIEIIQKMPRLASALEHRARCAPQESDEKRRTVHVVMPQVLPSRSNEKVTAYSASTRVSAFALPLSALASCAVR